MGWSGLLVKPVDRREYGKWRLIGFAPALGFSSGDKHVVAPD